MKQIKLAFMLLTIMIALVNCTFENRTSTTQVCLKDLDMYIQDTIKKIPIDIFGCCPDLIDLTGHYKLIIKEFGPWCYAQKLTNIETGKYYWFDYSTPRPIIVTAKEIIFPTKYNLINRGRMGNYSVFFLPEMQTFRYSSVHHRNYSAPPLE